MVFHHLEHAEHLQLKVPQESDPKLGTSWVKHSETNPWGHHGCFHWIHSLAAGDACLGLWGRKISRTTFRADRPWWRDADLWSTTCAWWEDVRRVEEMDTGLWRSLAISGDLWWWWTWQLKLMHFESLKKGKEWNQMGERRTVRRRLSVVLGLGVPLLHGWIHQRGAPLSVVSFVSMEDMIQWYRSWANERKWLKCQLTS